MQSHHGQQLSQKLLATFLDLVRLDSPSGQEGPVREYLLQRFHRLGLAPQVDAAGNIVLAIAGNSQAAQHTVLMTGHMDVVPPCIGVKPVVSGEGDDCVIRSSGDTVLGADDKAGLAPMLEALAMSLEHNTPRPDLLFVITVDEEVNLSGAKRVDPACYGHADFAIALDHTGEQGTIIYEAPSYRTFAITVQGKSVHAGIMPERGINAIQILGSAVDSLSWGRLDSETTANVGFIKGGKATNIVPDWAQAQGEVRSHAPQTLDTQLAHIETALQTATTQHEGATCQMESAASFEHYRTDLDHPHLQRIVSAMKSLDLPVNLIRTNGGSDVNVFATQGVPGVVLSAGYINPHALTEHVYLKDMVTCTHLLLAIWEQFAQ